MRRALGRLFAAVAAPLGTVVHLLGRVLPGLIGVGLVSYGAWLAWAPAGFICAGLLLLVDRAWEMIRADRRTQ